MNEAQLKALLQDVADHAGDDLQIRDKVVYDSALPRRWPQLNWNRLLTIYGDRPGNWPGIIQDYLEMEAKDP